MSGKAFACLAPNAKYAPAHGIAAHFVAKYAAGAGPKASGRVGN